jgi:hypothetical protein
VKPAGEDLLNDMSDPALGCEFTITPNPFQDGSGLALHARALFVVAGGT